MRRWAGPTSSWLASASSWAIATMWSTVASTVMVPVKPNSASESALRRAVIGRPSRSADRASSQESTLTIWSRQSRWRTPADTSKSRTGPAERVRAKPK